MLQEVLREMKSGKYYVVSYLNGMGGDWNHKIEWEGAKYEEGVQYISVNNTSQWKYFALYYNREKLEPRICAKTDR